MIMKKSSSSQAWWCTPLIPALGSQWQADFPARTTHKKKGRKEGRKKRKRKKGERGRERKRERKEGRKRERKKIGKKLHHVSFPSGWQPEHIGATVRTSARISEQQCFRW